MILSMFELISLVYDLFGNIEADNFLLMLRDGGLSDSGLMIESLKCSFFQGV